MKQKLPLRTGARYTERLTIPVTPELKLKVRNLQACHINRQGIDVMSILRQWIDRGLEEAEASVKDLRGA